MECVRERLRKISCKNVLEDFTMIFQIEKQGYKTENFEKTIQAGKTEENNLLFELIRKEADLSIRVVAQ